MALNIHQTSVKDRIILSGTCFQSDGSETTREIYFGDIRGVTLLREDVISINLGASSLRFEGGTPEEAKSTYQYLSERFIAFRQRNNKLAEA